MRELLGASIRRARAIEDDDELDARRVVPRTPGKLTAADADGRGPGDPGKRSRAAEGTELMTAGQAIAFADWMTRVGPIDRRAEAEVDDEHGALSSAFEFLATRRGGQPLPDALRRRLEAEVAVDLGSVRVHTDDRAARAAAALHARAFTIGDDIYFAAGAFAPQTDAGVELIAHEIAHVAQQRAGGRATVAKVSRPDDAHERAADEIATRFRAGYREELGSASPPTRDPAALVNHVRTAGARFALPYLPEIEEVLGVSLASVEAFTGDAAALACNMMAAGAFAVRNVVAFADPSPARELLLHELTHVVQMGLRKAPAQFGVGSLRVSAPHDAAEVEARGRAGRPQVPADPDTIHRAPAPTATTGTGTTGKTTTPKERWEKFRDSWLLSHTLVSTGDDLKTLRFGILNGKLADGTPSYNPRFKHSSDAPFMIDDFRKEAESWGPDFKDQVKDDDLSTLYGGGKPADAPGLTKVSKTGTSGRKWAWLGPAEPYHDDVVDMLDEGRARPIPWQQWKEYSEWIEALGPKVGKVALAPPLKPDINANEHSPYTPGEADKFRAELYRVIADGFAMKDGQWKDFYDTIVSKDPFKKNTGLVGNAFEEVVKKTIAGGKSTSDVKRPHFDLPGGAGAKDYLRHGDMEKLDYSTEIKALVIECKAYNLVLGPDGKTPADKRELSDELKSQAEDYAKIIGVGGGSPGGTKIPGFDMKDGKKVNLREFNHVVYVFPTAQVAAQWNPDLKKIFPAGTYSLVPAPGTMKFPVTFNPTLSFDLDAKSASHHLTAPPTLHPGLKVHHVDLELKAPGSPELASGSISVEPSLGAAMKADKPETKVLTATATGASAENKLSGLKSPTLDKLLKRFDVAAKLTDAGVEANVTIAAGPSGIPSFNLEASALTVKYTDGSLTVAGELGLAHASGKLSAKVKVGWDGVDWTFEGAATVAAGLIDGLQAFTAKVKYANGQWSIGCDSVQYEKKLKAVTLTGTATGVWYDINKGTFSGMVGLEADLGMFGKASADATIADNKLARATLSYDSPVFKYPAKQEPPSFKGTIGGTLIYENDKLSGAIRGSANLNVPALKKLAGDGGVGLAVDAHIQSDGSYSGTVKTTSPLMFGEHLQVPSVACTIKEDGSLTGSFEIKILKIKFLHEASIKCTVTKDGVEIEEAKIEVPFGTENKSKLWGKLAVGYSKSKGLQIGGQVNAKIKEGMIATGDLTYSTETHAVSLKMTVSEITLLDKTVSKTLFKAAKQIPIINVWGLGVYIDIGFDLGFDFGFKLGFKPTVEFEELSLETFEYKKIAAKLELLGEIFARLTGTPKLGLGIFALDPAILRGGGGLKVPIVGEAKINPTGTLNVSYAPDGGVQGDAKLGMNMTFGMTGSVKPYAEFSVLDGLWNPTWDGDALARFEILKPKELFNFTVDLGGDMTKKDPELPASNAAKEPTKPAADRILPEQKAAPTEHSGPAAAAATEGAKSPVAETGDEGPFSMAALAPLLEKLPGAAAVKKILQKAGEVWDKIKGFFGRIVKAFKSFFDSMVNQLEEILDGFAKEGLGYVPKLVKKIVGDTVYEIIEPLVKYVAKTADALLEMFETNPPAGVTDFMPWTWKLASKAGNLGASSITGFVSAVRDMMNNLADMTKKLINKAVADGWIGVKRHGYYIWRPWPLDNVNFVAATEYKLRIPGVISLGNDGSPSSPVTPDAAIALGLYTLLEEVGVSVTYSGWDPKAKAPYNDRWAGQGAR